MKLGDESYKLLEVQALKKGEKKKEEMTCLVYLLSLSAH
jgi:hypothetical protein